MGAAETTPRLFVHIGLQKTGTSFLQRILWDSVDPLAAQGVELVPGSKQQMFRLMLDVRGRYNPEIDPPSVAQALERLPQQLAAARPTALISQEALSAATAEQVARFVAATADREMHVLVTLRDLGRQIPSTWQQTLQQGGSEPLDSFLRRLHRTAGSRAPVWRSMDVPRILGCWAEHVPPSRIHVVTVPPAGSAPTVLLDRFCSVVGLDPATLVIAEDTRGNRGLRADQAELLRRVNQELPTELKRRDVYGDLGKRYFAVQVLGDDEGTRIRLPGESFAWCHQVATGFVDHVRSGGYQVVGDLDDLLPRRGDVAPEGERRDESDIARIATRALAQMLGDRMTERKAARTAPPPVAPGRPTPLVATRARARRALTRLLGR